MDILTVAILSGCAGFFAAAGLAIIPLRQAERRAEAERKARHHWEQAHHRAAKGHARMESLYLDLLGKAYVRKGRAFVRLALNG